MIRVQLREAIQAYEQRTGEQLSYAKLAERTGLSRATLESLGSRGAYNTTLATIDRLCEVLGCGIPELIEFVPSSSGESE